MPYPTQCAEWQLLQALGNLFWTRKRKVMFEPIIEDGDLVQPDDEFLEVELRRTFLARDASRNLPDDEFEQFQATVRNLCAFLENSVVVQVQQQPDRHPHPLLYGVVGLLGSLDGELSHTFDLVAGPGPGRTGIFALSGNPKQARASLDSISECNNVISRLLTSRSPTTTAPSSSPIPPLKDNSQRPWKDCRKRNRAVSVLHALFRHFKCGTAHELVLRMSENSEEFHLFLSSCLGSNVWQDTRCSALGGNVGLTVSQITNICDELVKYKGQGMSLSLLIQSSGVFGSWAGMVSNKTLFAPQETLGDLIDKKAFEPSLKYEAFKAQEALSVRFTPLEVRRLAVQLGYCLMDFFDADLSSKKIYFLRQQPGRQIQKDQPCISFDSSLPAAEILHTFQIGHPTLLSFARLLLEIYSGASVPAGAVSRDYDQNNQAIWLELCVYLERLENERGDSYLKAVRGCLMVHRKISKALHSEAGDDRDAVIRKALYKSVVRNLEQALAEATPRARHKRQRSESPPPLHKSQRLFEDGTTSLTCGSIVGRTMAPRDSKKRRPDVHSSRSALIYCPKPRVPAEKLVSFLGMASASLFDDTTPTDFPTNICHYADAFMGTLSSIYERTIQDEVEEGTRIKVAVLDTGLDIGHPDIQASRERILECRSWLGGLDGAEMATANDPCGHGTHVTSLLLHVAPDCDVYVAQIADSGEPRPISARMIAKAMTHAVSVWKVDVISMSFGFTDENDPGCDELREAILMAHSAGVLLFAAASNSGAHSATPAFPARMNNVFCIFSGDGMGNSAPTNPTPRRNRYNFMTVGEAVESAWPRALCDNPWTMRKSGTSFATPIAAGIAACLLLYAMQNLPLEAARRFKQFDKMEDLLFHLSNERNGYNVLTLKDFFDRPPEERSSLLLNLLAGKPWKV